MAYWGPISRETQRESPPWADDADAVSRRLGSDLGSGLSQAEAAARFEREGPNELVDRPPTPPYRQLLAQFTDVTVLALIAAAAVAVVLGWTEKRGDTFLHRFGDAVAIGLIVLLNAAIGFAQERKAERALAALRQLGAPSAKVIREGRLQSIPTRELVVGDLIEVSEGDRVPADGRLVETADLVSSEAALTGESAPVDKLEAGELSPETPLAERANMVFTGTHVARGRGRAVVVASGMATELGRIASLLGRVAPPQTPLQKSLHQFGVRVVIGCAVMGVVVFAVGLARLEASLGFLLLTAVSLAVAAIPEGLPAVTTIVLALGVQRMARKNALVRRLAAVETLGSTDRICTDKTGTLTQNRMFVRRVWAGGSTASCGAGDDPPGFELDDQRVALGEPGNAAFAELVLACSCAPAARLSEADGTPCGDPTDVALLRVFVTLADEAGLDRSQIETVRVLPFERDRRMATVVLSTPSGTRSFTHGAPEAVLEQVTHGLDAAGMVQPLEPADRERIGALVEAWAADGLRVIALGRAGEGRATLQAASLDPRDQLIEALERQMVLVGLVGLADPPRPEVAAAIEKARAAGVTTIMITGDHPLTGAAIGREIGIFVGDGEVLTGPQIDAMPDAELTRRIERVRVVARATAENKLRLVRSLRARGHVVAMTGDGVNDAPAIKAASIGIAMGRGGTDVTREAADMVLLDDNYATIVAAIEQGRIVYGNIKRFIVFLFAVNAGLVLSVFVAAALGWPPILTPTQILWINLITNGLPALALGMEPVHLDPMRARPRSPAESLVSRAELVWLLAYGCLMAALGLGVFARYHAVDPNELARARTVTFCVLAIAPLFHALNARSRTDSLFSLGVLSNRLLLAAFGVALLLQAVAVYTPGLSDVFSTAALGARDAAVVLAVCATVWVVGELEKAIHRLLVRGPGS